MSAEAGRRAKLVGQPLPPAATSRFVVGQGYYTDDHVVPGAAHMVVVRTPHAAADIPAVRTQAAAQGPGVLAVLTGADLAADGVGGMRSLIARERPGGTPHFEPPYPLLAQGSARHVGFPVAIVIAETLGQAQQAAELVDVEYVLRPSVTETRDLLRPDITPVWEDATDNVCFVHEVGHEAAVEQFIASAPHVVTVEVEMTRVTANPMEMRNAIGQYDSRTSRYTLWTGAQLPHDLRNELLPILGIAAHDLRIISPDIGGAFGVKLAAQPEQALVLWASRRVGRPVRWRATRNEALQSDWHARDVISRVTLALDEHATFLALRVDSLVNLGAYLHAFTMHCPTANLGGIAGPYRTPHIFTRVTGAFSNTTSNGAYRGAGRPEATYVTERVIDAAARKLGIDRAEIRRRNLIPSSAMPYNTGFVFTYDCGAFEANLDSALEMSAWTDFAQRREQAAARGGIRGIGVACAIEIAGGPQGAPTEEFLELRFDNAGGVMVLTGLHSHGHGLETVLLQLLHDLLYVPIEKMRVMFGDTDQVYHGKGSGGSRSSAAAAATTAMAARRIIEKGRTLAAHLLEAAEQDIEFTEGRFVVAGTDRGLALADVARISFDRTRLPKGMDIGLTTTVTIAAGDATFPNGCHVCEVEIDPETGGVTVVGYWAVEDIGRVLNPLVAEGQIQGGVVQGIGQALCEKIVYDPESGQLLSATFMDYAMPRADTVSNIESRFLEVPTTTNPFGAKGVGEAGTVASIAAVMSAVNDALASVGADEMEMPATPFAVWQALNSRRPQSAVPENPYSGVAETSAT
jgi:carbon-monoxide dehydrogenase large subunit